MIPYIIQIGPVPALNLPITPPESTHGNYCNNNVTNREIRNDTRHQKIHNAVGVDGFPSEIPNTNPEWPEEELHDYSVRIRGTNLPNGRRDGAAIFFYKMAIEGTSTIIDLSPFFSLYTNYGSLL